MVEQNTDDRVMDYNTEREPLLLKEYGRNVQNLVKHITQLPDKKERTEKAYTLIQLMKQLNPSVKENSDNPQRIWDHLFVMSDFQLDIDGPFPMPDRSILDQKPLKMEYFETEVKFRHYGRNVEILIEKALAMEDEEEKHYALIQIGKLMKTFYYSWNGDIADDTVIVSHLKQLSGGRADLTQSLAENNNSLFDISGSLPRIDSNHQENSYSNNYKKRGGRGGGKKRRRK